MWLINCRTLALEEFVNHKEVRYAILSHTWENGEEVQYDEINNRGAREKRGWQKITKTCQLALDDGCDFAWVDTCCIDKKSSAELTEAINSMFPWYTGSEICYTYLADYDASDPDAEMSQSRWFTRGWTLQELIAPARVHFYDKSWNSIGTKDELSPQLSLITGIGQEVLLASKRRHLEESLNEVPIARRMSWAAKRETTRIEDTAYCLLGIFGINFPLLYGEGERAFTRLQEEIVKNSNDLSLLAWLSPKDETSTNIDRICGIFASHPREFQASDKLTLTNDVRFIPDFTMTNKGLKIHTLLHFDPSEELHVLELNCQGVARPQQSPPREVIAIYLKHQGASVFARAKPYRFASMDLHSGYTDNRSLFLSKSIIPSIASSLQRVHYRSFHVPVFNDAYHDFVAAKPEAFWDSANEMFITTGLQDFVGCHEYSCEEEAQRKGGEFVIERYRQRFSVVFGFGYGFNTPWVRIVTSDMALHKYIKAEDWRQVAQVVHPGASEHLNISVYHYGKKKQMRLYAKLEQRDIQGGGVVHWIQLLIKYKKGWGGLRPHQPS